MLKHSVNLGLTDGPKAATDKPQIYAVTTAPLDPLEKLMLRLVHAFRNSLAALKFGLTREAALREEMIIILLSLPVAPLLTLNPWKLIALWGSLLLLLAVEFLNTGIEKLADRVTRDDDNLVKVAKDCGSAAVLMTILLAAVVWGVTVYERFFAAA